MSPMLPDASSRSTLIRSDKIFRIAEETTLCRLLHSNLLLIGSPAVSFGTRDTLERVGATFPFNIGDRDYLRERDLLGPLQDQELFDPDRLASYLGERTVDAEMRRLLAIYRRPGFVDPLDPEKLQAISVPLHKD